MAERGAGATQRSPMDLVLKYVKLVVIYSVAIFWSIHWLIRQPMIIWQDPPAYFRTKKRSLPAVLRNHNLGKDGYLQLQNGTRIHYVAAGEPDRKLMLCLHGFPDFWFSWRHQLRYFKDDYYVVAVDLRGYGDSSKPSGVSAYTVVGLIEDVRLIIESLGHKNCVLAGHDWGGIISWAFATKFPDMVSKLIILNAPHPVVFRKFVEKNPKQLLMSWYVFVFQLPLLPEFMLTCNDMRFLEEVYIKPPMGAKPGTISAEEFEAYKYTFGAPNAFTPPVNYYRNSFSADVTKQIQWAPVPCPIFVIFGTNDQALSSELAVLSGQFAGGDFEVKYLEGISHWCHQEAPAQVNEAISKFLHEH